MGKTWWCSSKIVAASLLHQRCPVPLGACSPKGTLLRRDGIGALWPPTPPMLPALLAVLGLRTVPLVEARSLHAFTALGPCLPIALTYCHGYGIAVDWDDLVGLGAQYALPNYEAILDWARQTYRQDLSLKELLPYLAQAATPGSVIEAVLDGVGQKHLSPGQAFTRGIGRSEVLAG